MDVHQLRKDIRSIEPMPSAEAAEAIPATTEPAEPPPHHDGRNGRAGVGERAQALLREQLANGPKPASQIEAAAEAAKIPEPALIAAAGGLGVRR